MERTSLYFTGPRTVEQRRSTVEISDEEMVVETRVSAVSAGTELLIYRGEAPTDVPADETLEALDSDLSYPVKYGYAAVGDVVATGDGVADEWLDRTVFAFNPHESRFTTTPDAVVPLPDAVGAERMAMAPSVETATSLVLDGRPRVGERVVVFGAGVIGLCTVGVLSSFPLDRIVAVDPVAPRRECAVELGADRAVAPGDVADVVDGWSEPEGADLVYELSGQPATLEAAVEAAGYDGRVVVGSWYGEKVATVDLGTDFHRDRISVESSQVSTLAPETRGRWTKARRMDTALDRLADLNLGSLVTHRVPFAEASDAYRLLDEGTGDPLQVLLTYDPGPIPTTDDDTARP
jgi:2-desacetyl-2-hydroxyethyl bacteriochlorophyllide A dehydrogenase